MGKLDFHKRLYNLEYKESKESKEKEKRASEEFEKWLEEVYKPKFYLFKQGVGIVKNKIKGV